MKCEFLISFLWVALALVIFYRGPYYASNMESFPDSGEYVTMAVRGATERTIRLPVENLDLPSRYQPWFSLMILAPSYVFLGKEPGNGIFSILAFGVLGLWVSGLFARRLFGWAGGTLAVLLLLITDYVPLSRKILTDVPAAVSVAIAAYGFARSNFDERCWRARDWLVIGGLSAAALWRSTYLVFVIPVLIKLVLHRRVFHLLVFGGVCATVIGLQLGFNLYAYGDPFRTGYAFWCPEVYNSLGTTFSWTYCAANIRNLALSRVGIVWAMALVGLIVPSFRQSLSATSFGRNFSFFWACSLPPFIALHLGYFFVDTRFFLPATVAFSALAGGWVGYFKRLSDIRWAAILSAFVVVLAIAWRMFFYQPLPPLRRMAADDIARFTPTNAWVISAIDPVYLRVMVGIHSGRTFIPLSRRVEYASKRVMLGWISSRDRGDRETPAAVPVICRVATEQLEEIERDVHEGKPVYLDTTHVDDYDMRRELESLLDRFELAPITERLYRLHSIRPNSRG